MLISPVIPNKFEYKSENWYNDVNSKKYENLVSYTRMQINVYEELSHNKYFF